MIIEKSAGPGKNVRRQSKRLSTYYCIYYQPYE
jgi:hypothetical protein